MTALRRGLPIYGVGVGDRQTYKDIFRATTKERRYKRHCFGTPLQSLLDAIVVSTSEWITSPRSAPTIPPDHSGTRAENLRILRNVNRHHRMTTGEGRHGWIIQFPNTECHVLSENQQELILTATVEQVPQSAENPRILPRLIC